MKKIILPLMFFCFCSFSLFIHPDRKLYKDPLKENIPHEVIKFQNERKETLVGLFFAPKDKPKATVIHFHGNAQNISAHWVSSYWLAQYGYNVFIFDYAGFGASEGKASIENMISDAKSAFNHALKLPGAQKDKLIIFAQSLGGAIAVEALAQMEFFSPKALIIEGSFNSYKEVGFEFAKKRFFLWPFLWYPKIFVSDKYSPNRNIHKFICPKIFTHSPKDNVVPFSQGKKLFENAKDPKIFWEIESGHIDTFNRYGEKYKPKLIDFLNSLN